MGSFSFKTQDTNGSIWNDMGPEHAVKPVYMVAPDGRVWEELSYGGYGEFGGKDFYELLSELNGGKSCRLEGIGMAFKDGDYPHGDNPSLIWPNLLRKNIPYKATRGAPKSCPHQGNYRWRN